jgi:hypothetical protein
MPAIEVEERLDELARVHEWIRYLGSAPLSDGTLAQRYQFVHALLWKAFRDSVVPSRRKALELKIDNAISRRKTL